MPQNSDLHNANCPHTFKKEGNSMVVMFCLTSALPLIHWLILFPSGLLLQATSELLAENVPQANLQL